MSKALTTQIVSNIEKDIQDAEHKIDEAQITEGEVWVIYALQLERIKKDFDRAKKAKQKPFGLNSFKAYCKSDRSRFHFDFCSKLVLALPDYRLAKSSTNVDGITWTEGALREVRKMKTTQGKESALKAAIKDHTTNGTPLGTAVKNAVADKSKTLKGEIEKRKEYAKQVDPARNLKALIALTEKHTAALKAQPRTFWTAADKAAPGVAARAARVVGELAALLKQKG